MYRRVYFHSLLSESQLSTNTPGVGGGSYHPRPPPNQKRLLLRLPFLRFHLRGDFDKVLPSRAVVFVFATRDRCGTMQATTHRKHCIASVRNTRLPSPSPSIAHRSALLSATSVTNQPLLDLAQLSPETPTLRVHHPFEKPKDRRAELFIDPRSGS